MSDQLELFAFFLLFSIDQSVESQSSLIAPLMMVIVIIVNDKNIYKNDILLLYDSTQRAVD